MQQLLTLYTQWAGHAPAATEQIPGAGSNRQYYRFTAPDGTTAVGVIGTSAAENHAFISIARLWQKRQLPTPRVLAVSGDEMRYLQTDLGSRTLFDALKAGREAGGRYTLAEQELLKRVMRQLPNLQVRGAIGMDWSVCYPQPEMDIDTVLFDLNYFKYCFLKTTGVDFHEMKLEASFRRMAKDLTSEPSETFLYRDFQARNIMLDTDGNPSFIDFQGGRRGPYYYDVASFLWQASAHYSFHLRRELIATYYDALKQYIEVPSTRHFAARLSLFVLFRTLQVLGAYGFRGYFEKKQHFIDSIPPAIQNLRDLLALRPEVLPYPYLRQVLQRLVDLPQYQPVPEKPAQRSDGYRTTTHPSAPAHPKDGPATFSKYDGKGPLHVDVYSFSYRKGIPDDPSGNGGGYVFDCRGTHNPGRYEPYKQLTGLDEPVIRFLEDNGEILRFLDDVYSLADRHVARYIERGFTHIQFAFGCTGGQHRSVYAAQHLAEHLNKKYGVAVTVNHREQGIKQSLPASR